MKPVKALVVRMMNNGVVWWYARCGGCDYWQRDEHYECAIDYAHDHVRMWHR